MLPASIRKYKLHYAWIVLFAACALSIASRADHGSFVGTLLREVLRLLMQQNGITQNELRDEVGGQSVVSAIINGKRTINSRQAKALAARFGISPAAFI